MKPVYLLFGQEGFLAEEEVKKLIEKMLPDGRNPFNFQVYTAGESSGKEVRTAVLTPAFGSGPKVVLVRHFSAWKVKEIEELLPLLDRWPPHSFLILWGDNVDKRTKVYLRFKKAGEAREFSKLSARELPGWLQSHARKQYGLKLTGDVAASMVRLIGDELRLLDRELEKLATYLGPENNQPSVADLEAITWQAAAVNIFSLVDAIGTRNQKKALDLLARMLQEGTEPLSLLGMIAWQLRVIFKIKALAGSSQQQLEKQLRLHPFVVKKSQQQAQGFKWKEGAGIFQALFNADLALKSSQPSARVLEGLVLELCSGREKKA